jgi:hypothetical protein
MNLKEQDIQTREGKNLKLFNMTLDKDPLCRMFLWTLNKGAMLSPIKWTSPIDPSLSPYRISPPPLTLSPPKAPQISLPPSHFLSLSPN